MLKLIFFEKQFLFHGHRQTLVISKLKLKIIVHEISITTYECKTNAV